MMPPKGEFSMFSDQCQDQGLMIEFDNLMIDVPDDKLHNLNEAQLKEWVWRNCKEEILSGMTVHKKSQQQNQHQQGRSCESSCGSVLSDKQLDLLERVAQAQRKYLQSEGPMAVYNCLLEGLLEMMGSEFGFIGEVRHDARDNMYLHINVSTDISWDEDTKRFYEQHHKEGLDFYQLNNLFGRVLLDRVPIIANDAKKDPRSTGLPPGHPDIKGFLGVPIFAQGGELLGMFAIANKPAGYTQRDVKFLEPFTNTCANVIQAYFANEENKRLIGTLEAANRELETANQKVLAASQLQLRHFACMSHEIRTPLNCIIGMLSLLQKSEDLTPMQHESMRLVVASGELLATVVNDVLDYSKLESGNVDFHISRRSFQETIDTVTRSINVKASAKNIVLRTILDYRIPQHVHTDHLRLQQILFNLLGNAIKFSKQGGTVELHVTILCHDEDEEPQPRGYTYYASDTESETESNSSSSRSSPKNCLRCVIKDYGKGLESNEFEYVFRPFFQTQEETKQVHGGTGLGLAITAKLVHGLGGSISVDSKIGEWSCFTVEFPLEDAPEDISAISQQLTHVTMVLISPDEPGLSSAIREELPKRFEAFGVDV